MTDVSTVLICGSRTDFDQSLAIKYLTEIRDSHPRDRIIHGGAVGIDSLADEIFRQGIGARIGVQKISVFRPDYARYGKSAPIVRDEAMVREADFVYALWNGTSRGTKFVIDKSLELKRNLVVYTIPDGHREKE